MPIHTKLAEGIDEVDVIIAGGTTSPKFVSNLMYLH